MKTCAVIIPAYRAEKWIMECVKGFQNQHSLEGWEYKIVVGVDGCKKTATALTVPYWWSAVNVGTYVMVNSLVALNPADMYVFFGADDVPFPDYLRKTIPVAEEYGYTRVRERRCDENLKPFPPQERNLMGTAVCTREVFEQVGGFHAYRCASDTDFTRRVKALGYKPKEAKLLLPDPLFYRRRHKNSLTRHPKTSMKSEYRVKVKTAMNELYDKGLIKITPTTTDLEYYGNH